MIKVNNKVNTQRRIKATARTTVRLIPIITMLLLSTFISRSRTYFISSPSSSSSFSKKKQHYLFVNAFIPFSTTTFISSSDIRTNTSTSISTTTTSALSLFTSQQQKYYRLSSSSSSSSQKSSTSIKVRNRKNNHYTEEEGEENDLSKSSSNSLESFIQEMTSTNDFFASEIIFPNFQAIGLQSTILLERVNAFLTKVRSNDNDDDHVPKPSAIQAASFKAIQSGNDITIGAETGSGKTLAYLLPLIDDILQAKMNKVKLDDDNNEDNEDDNNNFYNDYYERNNEDGIDYDYARAVILVPNKELANQVMNMAIPLCGGPECVIWGPNGETTAAKSSTSSHSNNNNDIVRIGFLPGELKSPDDYKPFRLSINDRQNNPPLDLLICTPASLGPWGLNPKNINVFADIQTIVIDEADMLFDGGYLRQLENTLLGFKRADRLDDSFGVGKTQHILVAATLPSMGTKSVDAYVQRKFPHATRITMKGMHNARHYGLGEKTIWLEDDYNEMTPKKKRMERLVQMLQSKPDDESSNGDDFIGLKGEKVMIFLNNVNDVDSATNALRRCGIEAVPFHAKLPLAERTQNLNMFRNFVAGQDNNEGMDNDDSGSISVLVCTDLAARGLDIPGVTAVVQLQFAGNVVTHLHRMGRCGRAGKRDGRGVIFYGGVESELVQVVQEAEQQQETMVLEGNDIEERSNEGDEQGKVEAAFSRRRGFTRKRKKLRKVEQNEKDLDG